MKSSTISDPLFVDTWGWLVLANESDPRHRGVDRLRQQSIENRRQWITSDYVLDETFTRVFSATPFIKARKFVKALFDSQNLGSLVIEAINPERFAAAWRLRLRYRDKPRISFTDLTSFVVMREAAFVMFLQATHTLIMSVWVSG